MTTEEKIEKLKELGVFDDVVEVDGRLELTATYKLRKRFGLKKPGLGGLPPEAIARIFAFMMAEQIKSNVEKKIKEVEKAQR